MSTIEPAWIAIDPGPHTGIAIWFPDTKEFKTLTLEFVGPNGEELVFIDDPVLQVWTWLEENVQPYDHLICEKFEYDRDKARSAPHLDYTAAEFVGVIKLWAEMKKVADFCYQTRGAVGRKAFWSNDKLRRVGLWKPGGADRYKHEMDATRHLLYHNMQCCQRLDWISRLR